MRPELLLPPLAALVALAALTSAQYSQANDVWSGSPCAHAALGVPGECLPLPRCPSAVSERRRGEHPQLCGFLSAGHYVPHVCCPAAPPPPPARPAPVQIIISLAETPSPAETLGVAETPGTTGTLGTPDPPPETTEGNIGLLAGNSPSSPPGAPAPIGPQVFASWFWDCCKPACAWSERVGNATQGAVRACGQDGAVDIGVDEESGCKGGRAYLCTDQQPFLDPDDPNLAYGFAAALLTEVPLDALCCSCYSLSFSEAPLEGKRLVVQVTASGADSNTFSVLVPGGGVAGEAAGSCAAQWGSSSVSVWGEQFGGVAQVEDCDALPEPLRPGCRFRFTWLANADFPPVQHQRVRCPQQLQARSQCSREDDPA